MKVFSPFTVEQINKAEAVIYLHKFTDGSIYIGSTGTDVVNRYNEHYQSATDQHCAEYNSAHHKALRSMRHTVFVVALTTKANMRDIEGRFMNSWQQTNKLLNKNPIYSYGKVPSLEAVVSGSRAIELCSRKNTNRSWDAFKDYRRDYVVCEIVWNRGKKRVQAPDGKFVKVWRSERDKFPVGTKVKVKIALRDDAKCYDAGMNTIHAA